MNNKVILDENVEIQFTGKQPLEEILIKLLLDEFRTFDDEKKSA